MIFQPIPESLRQTAINIFQPIAQELASVGQNVTDVADRAIKSILEAPAHNCSEAFESFIGGMNESPLASPGFQALCADVRNFVLHGSCSALDDIFMQKSAATAVPLPTQPPVPTVPSLGIRILRFAFENKGTIVATVALAALTSIVAHKFLSKENQKTEKAPV